VVVPSVALRLEVLGGGVVASDQMQHAAAVPAQRGAAVLGPEPLTQALAPGALPLSGLSEGLRSL
jgi:hypothetical protein